MSGGQQDANRGAQALDACDDAVDALMVLFRTDAYDRAFGLHPQIAAKLNRVFERYGLKLVKVRP